MNPGERPCTRPVSQHRSWKECACYFKPCHLFRAQPLAGLPRMPSVKVLEIMRRIKGFSTPLGGVDWDLPLPQRAVAEKVVVYLEDRRVLTMPRAVMHAVEEPDHCVASVLQIRETLTQILMEPDTGDDLADNLKAMRAACRRFLPIRGYGRTGPDRSSRAHRAGGRNIDD